MSRRDYAKKPRTQPQRQPPRRRAKASKGIPGWAWLVAGLLIGLFVAFLVYIQQHSPAPARPATAARQPAAKPKPAPAPELAAAAKPKPKPAEPAATEEKDFDFDFYKILPEYEVVIPEEDLRTVERADKLEGAYMLQVGSFRRPQDAETRKAELALLGLVSKVQAVTVKEGEIWHRVRLGPFTDPRELDRARRRLQANDIEFITVREKS